MSEHSVALVRVRSTTGVWWRARHPLPSLAPGTTRRVEMGPYRTKRLAQAWLIVSAHENKVKVPFIIPIEDQDTRL